MYESTTNWQPSQQSTLCKQPAINVCVCVRVNREMQYTVLLHPQITVQNTSHLKGAQKITIG